MIVVDFLRRKFIKREEEKQTSSKKKNNNDGDDDDDVSKDTKDKISRAGRIIQSSLVWAALVET